MVDITRTIGTATGDESTIAAAITWGQNSANYDRSTDDVLILQIVDAEEFNESLIHITGFTGSPTSAKYARLETASAVRHDGTYNTSKARIRGNTAGQVVLLLNDPFAHARHLAIQQDNTSSSNRVVTFGSNVNDVIVEKCVIDMNQTTVSQTGLADNGVTITDVTIFDCVIKLNAGNGAGIRCFQGGAATSTIHIEHCTIDMDGASDANEGGIVAYDNNASAIINMNIDNTAVFDQTSAGDYSRRASLGTVNFDGQGNMGSDTTCRTLLGTTNNLDSQVLNTVDEADTDFLVTSLTAAAENYQL